MTTSPSTLQARPSLAGHIDIARFDHWPKNVFVLPGVVAALALDPRADLAHVVVKTLVALLATGLVASSNYTLNEVIDAPFDLHHPQKRTRPVPSGRVHIGLAYLQWLVLAAVGLAIGFRQSAPMGVALLALWIMGIVYNVRPVRTKDVPYLDVLTEAVNNPLRMLIGWYAVSALLVPPGTLVLSYWFVGCYFMAIKRLSEIRELGVSGELQRYRKSVAWFSEPSMLVAIQFYASAAMLFFGAFLLRYRLEMIVTFPLVALVMAQYLHMAFLPHSAAQHPEKLYRQPRLMISVVACVVAMAILFFAPLPWIRELLAPTVPVR